MKTFSPRLQKVFDQLIVGEDVWDLCCDHGYLGMGAYLSRQFHRIYFVDRVAEIIQSLEEKFHKSLKGKNPDALVEFLSVDAGKIHKPMSGNVVICGVGGSTILEILNSLEASGNLKARRIILGPHTDENFFESPELIFGLQNYFLMNKFVVPEGRYQRAIFVFDCKNSK